MPSSAPSDLPSSPASSGVRAPRMVRAWSGSLIRCSVAVSVSISRIAGASARAAKMGQDVCA
jgi:hypothetical protein